MFESVSAHRRPNWLLRLAGLAFLLSAIACVIWIWRITQMPLSSYRGAPPPLTADESQITQRLAAHVKYLSETIGERHLSHPDSLQRSRNYIRETLQNLGYAVFEQVYSVGSQRVGNLEAILNGNDTNGKTIVVGAHYDSARGTRGANDNASGVAAVLELARLLQGSKPHKSIRFVFFVNEEPPYFQTDDMGSVVYARQLRHDGVPVSAMISLETIGYYSDVQGSQKYPPVLNLFYPRSGNFVGFVGNPDSRGLVREVIRRFRQSTSFPSEGVAAPSDLPGVGWSDHWSFWQQGYPAIMVTDTALFRYPYYHTPQDTVDHLDFDRMARAVGGVRHVIDALAAE